MNKKILLVTWDAAGNTVPELALVQTLTERGYHIRVLGHDSLKERFEEAGANFQAFKKIPEMERHKLINVPDVDTEKLNQETMEKIVFGEAFIAELQDQVAIYKPDAIMCDWMLALGQVAAEATGLPVILVWHTVYGAVFKDNFGKLLNSHLDSVNASRKKLKLPTVTSFQEHVERATTVLICTYQPFDMPVENLPPNFHYVGPLRPQMKKASWRPEDNRSLVLVSLSSGGQNQLNLLQRIIDALEQIDVSVLVTVGRAVEPRLLRCPSNTKIDRLIPHDQVLPHARLLINHAGLGTIMAGVRYGVPLLCIPMGKDQPMNVRLVETKGIGKTLSPQSSVSTIRKAIQNMLSDKSCLKKAQQFAQQVVSHPDIDTAAALIDKVFT